MISKLHLASGLRVGLVAICIALAVPQLTPPTASAAWTDSDHDGVSDSAEAACGGAPADSRRRPERIDDLFANRDDNGDGQQDEALPPGASAYDCDGDGYTGAAEPSIFGVAGRDQDACGTDAWPSDIVAGGTPDSTNRVTLTDLTSFLAPVRRLNTSPPQSGFSPRWDLVPGPGTFLNYINLQDMTATLAADTGLPPMLGGARAFNGRPCPWPLAGPAPAGQWVLSTTIPNATYNDMVGLVPIPDRPDEAVVLRQKAEAVYRISLSGAFTPALYGDLSTLAGGSGSEEGVLALAFPPGFPGDSRVYVYYAKGSPSPSVLARFTVAGDQINLASKEELLLIPQPYDNHNGGQLMFGPDGDLYLSLGDGGGAGDPLETGQDNTDLPGSVLRIDVSAATGYTVPPDNPFVSAPGADEVWAYGLRNPWRYSFDRETGELWLADVGQAAWEEVDKVISGGNYGWDCYEGNASYEPAGCGPGPYQWPRLVYDHSVGCSITGGYVYHGALYPELAGWYVYGDYCSGRIWGVNLADSSSAPVLLLDSPYSITSFAQLPSGEIAVVTFNNAIYLLNRS